jgi:hypothetical protein
LVGQSSSTTPGIGNTTLGTAILSGGLAAFSRAGGAANATLYVNKNTDDGPIVRFSKDGSTVGSIGAYAGDVYIGEGDTALRFNADNDLILPFNGSSGSLGTRDGFIDLGTTGGRFKDLYLSGGVVASASSGNSAHTFTATANNTRATLTTSAKTSGGVAVEGQFGSFGDASKVDIGTLSNHATAFITNNTERMRIDSSGNLLVGTTNVNQLGITLRGDSDYIYVARNEGITSYFDRKSTDGAITEFRKDGTPVGNIGTYAGDLTIGDDDVGIRFDTGVGLVPWDLGANSTGGAATDGAIDIGAASARFKDLYRSGSTISTSDRNLKQDIRDLTDAERNVAVAAKGLLKAFRFIDRVEEEGASANIHFGIIAQDLAAAFTAEGLDANDYQVYRADTFTDDDGNEQTRLGICYENLLAFIIAAI